MIGSETFPWLLRRLRWKYNLCDGLWKFSKHKNIRNKPRATGARWNASGTETALLDFIPVLLMQRGDFIYTLYTHYFSSLDSQKKNGGRENTPLTRIEKKKWWRRLQPMSTSSNRFFQCFLCCTASWFEWCGFSLLKVMGISTVTAHI